MIRGINKEINFKGFYERNNSNFSDIQNRIVDDIKLKLDNKVKYGDYMVSPGAIQDTVELQHFIFGFTQNKKGKNTTFTYPKGSNRLIGVYSEKQPFEIKDLEVDKWEEFRHKSDNTWKFIGSAIIVLGALLIGNGAIKKFSTTPKKEILENFSTQTKDSLNTLKKDSLNLFI